jgi:RNA polymerase sigma-70 factor (ECF subfamily)
MRLLMELAYEQELVKKAKESLKAFDKIYEYYLPKIYGYIFNRTFSKEISEDVVSQTFIKAMTNIKSFKYRGYSFGAWLYRIAHNALMDYYRKNPSIETGDAALNQEDPDVDCKAENDEMKSVVLKALRKIPSAYQEILSLKFFEELSNKEIADIIGCKKETLAVKLHRSLKAFKKVLIKNKYLNILSIFN